MLSRNLKHWLIAFILGVVMCFVVFQLTTAQGEKEKNKDAWKGVRITTADLKVPYEHIGTVGYGKQLTGGIISDPVLKAVITCEKEMQKQAEQAGANAIIGVQVAISIAPQEAYLLMYGTAVKTTE
jgi:hypothetical protein